MCKIAGSYVYIELYERPVNYFSKNPHHFAFPEAIYESSNSPYSPYPHQYLILSLFFILHLLPV